MLRKEKLLRWLRIGCEQAARSQDSETKCPSHDSQELPLLGLGILCLILIAVMITLVIKNRGIRHELKKRDLERGAGKLRKNPRLYGSSEITTGIKSKGSGSASKTVGSKESGSKDKSLEERVHSKE
ncbi:hypothetical protein GCK32_013644 [Trichostrongylus colubriformis]|uniref:Uncharacterized protein n=1 Tax=Trichostrongylus colubriformis TaxID=6319 RepID=A0AAN8IBG1_TRICO